MLNITTELEDLKKLNAHARRATLAVLAHHRVVQRLRAHNHDAALAQALLGSMQRGLVELERLQGQILGFVQLVASKQVDAAGTVQSSGLPPGTPMQALRLLGRTNGPVRNTSLLEGTSPKERRGSLAASLARSGNVSRPWRWRSTVH